jgi:hypothetical protein
MDDMNDFDLVPSNVDIEMAPQPDNEVMMRRKRRMMTQRTSKNKKVILSTHRIKHDKINIYVLLRISIVSLIFYFDFMIL